MAGCLNPNAVNYSAGAVVDDFSCLYLFKHNGQCLLFKDVDPKQIEDKSFTISYSMLGNNWVFYHDYAADMYLHTHTNLYSLKDGQFFKHNAGAPGVYYTTTPNSFFVDVIFSQEIRRKLGQVASDSFREAGDLLLQAVQWVTEVISSISSTEEQKQQTLTHISIWNSRQHSGRIKLDPSKFTRVQNKQLRRTQGAWSFNDFRDLLNSFEGDEITPFLLDIFNNFQLDATQVPTNPLPWYQRKMLQDQWFCVRFEFDNTSGKNIMLHDMIIQAQKTDR